MQSLSRTLAQPRFESPPGPVVRIDGTDYLYFGGTSYLGLHAHPEVIAATRDAATRYGVHSATSRLRAGVSPPVADVEASAAKFFGTDAAVHCASGYLSPWLLLQAIADSFDVLLLEERAHYCLRDAAACSGLPRATYGVDDVAGLARQIATYAARGLRPLLMTDGFLSATGELSPLETLVGILASCPGAGLLVDDAHGFGAIGAAGRGCWDVVGLWPAVNLLKATERNVRLFACGTLGKALGGYGGIVPCDFALSEAIREHSNVYRGAAPPAAPTAAASARALELAIAEPERRTRLAANLNYLKQGLIRLGIEVSSSCAPLCPIREFRGRGAGGLHEYLRVQGIYVPQVRGYGGAGDDGVLRIVVFADHDCGHLDALLKALDGVTSAGG